MEASLRSHFGSTCETFSPSEGSCDLFVSSSKPWVELRRVREVAKANRWTYEVLIESGQTRVRFMMGSPLWDLNNGTTSVVANTTIQHALDNGLFLPKPARTRAVHVGTTETVEIKAVRGVATRLSVPLAEALLDRSGVLDIRIRRGSVDIVCRSRKQPASLARQHGLEPCQAVDRRLQRAVARIVSRRVARAASARSSTKRHRRMDSWGAAKAVQRVPRVRGTVPGALHAGSAGQASAAGGAPHLA